MSEKLVVEFYDRMNRSEPLVSVLAYHGGQEPEPAAWKIAAFLDHVRTLKDPRMEDAGVLAARFIVWLAHECRESESVCDFHDVALIRNSGDYKYYLVARIYADGIHPKVEFVNDSLSPNEEFAVAERIVNLALQNTPRAN